MLPQVNPEYRRAQWLCDSRHKWIILIVRLSNDQVWLALADAQPYPTRQTPRAYRLLHALNEALVTRVLLLYLLE